MTPNPRASHARGQAATSLDRDARRQLAANEQTTALSELLASRWFATCEAEGAAQLAPALRRLMRAGAEPASLAAHANLGLARLAQVGRDYTGMLSERRHFDAAEAYWAAARRAEPRAIAVSGYTHLGPDEAAYIEAIAGPGSVVTLPTGDPALFQDNLALAARFAALGWTVESDAHDGVTDAEALRALVPHREAIAYPSTDAEVRGTLARVKQLLAEGVSARDITLVARDDAAYGPSLLAVAREYEIPLEASYAIPLRETRLGSWLRLVTEVVVAKLAFEPTFRLLTHPLEAGQATGTYRQALASHPASAPAWAACGADVGDLAWPDEDARAGWAARVSALLVARDIGRRAARAARDMLAYRKLEDALEVLGAPADERLSLSAFLRELGDVLDRVTVPAQPGRGGVGLHTPLALHGAKTNHLFVLGMAEGVLPAPIADDPVLDFFTRKQLAAHGLHLEDAAAAARRETISFLALLATAPTHLVCSYARLHFDKPVLPSPFFDWLELVPGPAPPRPACSPEEARRVWLERDVVTADPGLQAARIALAVERRREGSEAPDGHDGVIGSPFDVAAHRFSATQLTLLGQCAFRWLASVGWRLREPDEADDALSPSVRGTLYHRALELALRPEIGQADPRPGLLGRLEAAFRDAEAEANLTGLPAWDRQRDEHLAVLRRAIAAPDFLAPGAVVAGVEAAFAGDWHGFPVRGSVDRIDQTPEGLVLIDYKTSSVAPKGAQDELGKAKVDVQLPLYASVAAATLFPDTPTQRAYYYSLTKGTVLREVRGEDPALATLAERLHGLLANGHFAVAPDVDEAACTYCDLAIVCRKGPRLARKAAAR